MNRTYKVRINNDDWIRHQSVEDLREIFSGLTARDIIQTKLECKHNKTWVENGVRICERCNEHLEITTFRD